MWYTVRQSVCSYRRSSCKMIIFPIYTPLIDIFFTPTTYHHQRRFGRIRRLHDFFAPPQQQRRLCPQAECSSTTFNPTPLYQGFIRGSYFMCVLLVLVCVCSLFSADRLRFPLPCKLASPVVLFDREDDMVLDEGE